MSADATSARRFGWRPTKFVMRGGTLRAGSAPFVSRGSVLVTELLGRSLGPLVKSRSAGSLVDVGCGNAPLLGVYGPLVDRATLVDWPASVHGEVRLDVFVDLRAELPFASSTFDTLILSDVLEHVTDPQALLDELARVARPGAWLLGSVPFMYGIHEEPHDHGRYTRYALADMFALAGFEVDHLDEFGGSMDVVVDVVAKHLSNLGAPGRLVAMGMQRFWVLVRGVPLAGSTRHRLRQKFPLGYVFAVRRNASHAATGPATEDVCSTRGSSHAR